ncbi:hypothetical protein [Deinococcus sp. QL22]|uniref:hypothetical protein n=1 Tax=Deinococcus sp. QL22 TaxID=2939437 RepID=UPI002017DC3C|nr:hypothetical protein [Deinococcus sp. QL22]UQN05984.1 hypothetical protein M1R55_14120 [Deinococcus sp. QL22]
MLPGLLLVLLISLNLGGLFSIIMQFGRGEIWAALGSLAFVLALNALGFWILRELRENG